MATALVTQIAYAVQSLFDPAGTAGRLVDLGKLANYGLLGGAAPTVWLPSELFTTGANGTWYDPSDMSTLFQNAAGTTPVTAVEQPVGRMFDKSGRGNHAFNSSGNSANFPVLSARYNLLTKTEDFSDAVWVVDNYKRQTVSYSSGSHNAFVVVKKTTSTWVAAGCQQAGGASSFAWFNLDTGQAGASSGIISSLTIQPFGTDGYYKCSFVINQPSAVGAQFYLGSATGNGVTPNGAALLLLQADLRVANDALNQPAYQRVNTASDYDTVGFKSYLKFNGVNQWLQTNSIDFSYGDKMFVSAGIRRLRNNIGEVVAELSTNYNSQSGTFALTVEQGPIVVFGVQSSGYSLAYYSDDAAPSSSVITTLADLGLSFDEVVYIRKNGSTRTVSRPYNANTTGMFGNYPLYIGARAGTSLWFNGQLHQLVVAGKQASASEITDTETFVNQKTGAY